MKASYWRAREKKKKGHPFFESWKEGINSRARANKKVIYFLGVRKKAFYWKAREKKKKKNVPNCKSIGHPRPRATR